MSSPTPFQSQFPHLARKPGPPGTGGGKTLVPLVVVGGGILVLGALGAAVGVWMVLSAPQFVPEELWEEQLAFVIESSVLPPGEDAAVLKEARRLARACKPAKMSAAQLEEVLTALQESPVFVLLDVGGIERDIVSASGLSQAEKEQGRRTVRRAARGVHAGKIPSREFYGALPAGHFYPTLLTVALSEDELMEYDNQFFDNQFFDDQFTGEPPPASDGDVRSALARLAALAEKAGVPDEPWMFDVSDEFATAVSGALAVARP